MLSLLVALPLSAARVEIVLDVSGSMRARAGDVTRIEAAQRAIQATVEAIDPGSNVALRLYGHRSPAEPKDVSCRDTELVIPFGPLDRQRFISAVASAKPLGQTPLAYALEQAAADFGEIGQEPVAIILVSDGEESCGGDPAKVACALRARGLELTVHTVGFGVNATARQQLQAVSSCTGGQYRDASNAGELADSLRQLTQAGLLVTKQREVNNAGTVVRGGNGFSSAVPINPGTYRLDHHQRGAEFDYFTLDVTPGHIVRVTQDTAALGVTIEGTKITETNNPVAGVTIYAPDQTLVAEDAKAGAGQRAAVSASVPAGKGGKYYVLVGQKWWTGWGIHHESPFKIEVVDATDAGSGTDAPESDKEALKIAPGILKAWMQPGETKDTYWFDAVPETTYQLRARPDGEPYSLQLTVRDEDGVELASKYAPNSTAAVRVESLKAPRAGKLFVTAGFAISDKPIPYTLELTTGASSAPTGAATSTSTSTTSETKTEGKRPLSSYLPGGCASCVAALIVLLLIVAGMIFFLVKLVQKNRKPRPPTAPPPPPAP
jgi:hypothetical protein